jgi:hypothetical protein
LIADEDTITIGSSQDAAINIGTGTTGEIMDNYGIDGFSTNGFMRLDYTDNDHHNAVETTTKRECIYASTRIIKINDANGAITVNNTNVLSGDHQSDNDQPTYIIFKTDSGGYASGGTKLTGIKIDYIEDGVVQLAKGTNYASILTVANLPNLRICREKYWLYIVMKMEDADANILNSKKYQTLSLSTDIGTPGATWNEYQFTSGLSYSKGWKDPITMRPKYEQDTDFGYGELDGELGTDGRLSESDGVESGVWNWVDISGAVEHGGSDEGERVSFNVEPLDNFLAETVTVNSVNHSANKPYLLGGFIDELPIISDFKVIPNEDNPYYPEFNWEVSGDDIWYGFLHIDNASILNQYHNAVVHYRLDGLARDEATATAPTEEISGLTTAISGPKYNVEGLAGFCLDFDGVDDYVQCGAGTYPASGSIDVTAECTTEMSVVVHFVANEALDDRYIISQSHENGKEKFSLKLNTSNQVVARVHYAAGANFVELTGSTIVTNDGVGPTCVILTVDTKLKSGNVKLYVNGNLDDMSGEMTVAGSSENWKAGQNINGGISNLFIGHRPVSGSSSFDGKLEEVVIYKSVIYPFGGKETSLLFTKPISELDNSSFTASKSYSAKLFIKDYHNIRGNNYTQVATSSSVSFRKAGFRLDNS